MDNFKFCQKCKRELISKEKKIDKINEIIFDSCDYIGEYRIDFRDSKERAYRSIVATSLRHFFNTVFVENLNNKGYPDIFLPLENRKHYLIECKRLSNKNNKNILQEAFEQLMGYSGSSHDDFFAIIIFNDKQKIDLPKLTKLIKDQVNASKNFISLSERKKTFWIIEVKKNEETFNLFLFICECFSAPKNSKTKKKI
ncbi:PD-(D/E)XK nuclease domain-containing protein [Candidatus Phytoplasma australiense]|uniref:Uncharacterized protein n=1 Tax=Strawberry lethal yellows phytoplasma (CPA) str. NZSb11 TaxID=980422 RepID=R4RN95_PHYAS|nr:PD-(D/E)XK nuclease domain-containing protein [Candidatus Phytoplasma australiense]AGL90840.1 Hypothetical Protein SLY_0925 [Strawberry lethal yellows phytoplasma (CPA) str. NZSb11]